MNDNLHTLRYSRHLALPNFGTAGQTKLEQARILIVGLGGLGSPAALYLAAAGVGTLMLNDFDRVDLSNLQRQILFSNADLNQPKTTAAAARLAALNPDCRIEILEQRLLGSELEAAVERANLVLDASDNFGTRFAVNADCVETKTPLISGAAIRYEGQMAVFDARDPASPCYACLYPETGEELENCRSNGILAPVVGIIGSFMALEAVKLLSGAGQTLTGRMLRLDAKSGAVTVAQIKKDPACPVCQQR
ncbi:MAG: HesA/MoeB/ThiF family protein [Gammaproteobacteria bacterium]